MQAERVPTTYIWNTHFNWIQYISRNTEDTIMVLWNVASKAGETLVTRSLTSGVEDGKQGGARKQLFKGET